MRLYARPRRRDSALLLYCYLRLLRFERRMLSTMTPICSSLTSFCQYFVTVAGVQYHLPLFAIEHEGAVIGCEPTSAGDQFVCVDVTHIHRSEDELSISLATKITQDGEEKASLDMGSFTFSFPGCRQRSSQCGESEVSAAPVYMAPTTTGVVATPPGQAPVVPHVTTSSAQHSSVLWILLLGAVVIACTVTIVLAVVGTLVYLKKRRDSFSNPETAYQMMIM